MDKVRSCSSAFALSCARTQVPQKTLAASRRPLMLLTQSVPGSNALSERVHAVHDLLTISEAPSLISDHPSRRLSERNTLP
eukprot:2489191-Pleurochrysis_carterae.AAC.2